MSFWSPGRVRGFALLAVLSCWAVQQARAQDVVLRGFVTDASDGQPLPSANVVVQDTTGTLRGAVAGPGGYYQLAGIPAGRYAVRISFIGYVPYVDTLMLGREPFATLTVALAPGQEMLEEVVVEREGGATALRAGQQRIRSADLARIPTPDVSGDLATYLQSLPGVVSLGDRGGSSSSGAVRPPRTSSCSTAHSSTSPSTSSASSPPFPRTSSQPSTSTRAASGHATAAASRR
jgi:hypothetical protein